MWIKIMDGKICNKWDGDFKWCFTYSYGDFMGKEPHDFFTENDGDFKW